MDRSSRGNMWEQEKESWSWNISRCRIMSKSSRRGAGELGAWLFAREPGAWLQASTNDIRGTVLTKETINITYCLVRGGDKWKPWFLSYWKIINAGRLYLGVVWNWGTLWFNHKKVSCSSGLVSLLFLPPLLLQVLLSYQVAGVVQGEHWLMAPPGTNTYFCSYSNSYSSCSYL